MKQITRAELSMARSIVKIDIPYKNSGGLQKIMSLLPSEKIEIIIETALMVADEPLSIANLQKLFKEPDHVPSQVIREHLETIAERHKGRGIELQEVATGFRLQAKAELGQWLAKLWEERSPRYSRAFLETLAIIAYKQPITRAEIEEIRGVTISSQIMKTLQEREWIKILGHREVPGRPAVFGTTKTFLDYFNLKSLTELPTLAEFKSIETQNIQLQLAMEQSEMSPIESTLIAEESEVHSVHNENNIVPIHDNLAEKLEF